MPGLEIFHCQNTWEHARKIFLCLNSFYSNICFMGLFCAAVIVTHYSVFLLAWFNSCVGLRYYYKQMQCPSSGREVWCQTVSQSKEGHAEQKGDSSPIQLTGRKSLAHCSIKGARWFWSASWLIIRNIILNSLRTKAVYPKIAYLDFTKESKNMKIVTV